MCVTRRRSVYIHKQSCLTNNLPLSITNQTRPEFRTPCNSLISLLFYFSRCEQVSNIGGGGGATHARTDTSQPKVGAFSALFRCANREHVFGVALVSFPNLSRACHVTTEPVCSYGHVVTCNVRECVLRKRLGHSGSCPNV